MVVYGLDRPFHGIGRYTTDLVQALVALNPAPEIVLLTAGGPGPLGGKAGLRQAPLPGCRLLPGLMTLGNALIPRAARRERLDIVHDPTGVTPFLFGADGARTVATVHDVIPWSYPGVSTRLETWIYRHWLPRLLPRVDGVVTISQMSKSEIRRHIGVLDHKIHVVDEFPNPIFRPVAGADVARVRAAHRLPEAYILYVGAVQERKNLLRLLHGYAKLRTWGIQHQLVIVGPRKWRYPGLMSTRRRLGLERHVIFTGYVLDADLPAIYGGADLFVFPSLFEGLPLPPLEAMACGVPVVTSNTPESLEAVGDAALMVDPYDAEALADAMRRLITDRSLRDELIRKGFKRVGQFTPERKARGTLAVYRRVLEAG
jgi:glycosyltransferase involved in cell wall biosynthesis